MGLLAVYDLLLIGDVAYLTGDLIGDLIGEFSLTSLPTNVF